MRDTPLRRFASSPLPGAFGLEGEPHLQPGKAGSAVRLDENPLTTELI
ncbi:MAG: hypothetical protein U1E02_12785 [Hydrogenophaga sp.]|nr:hypothetical protein [Hydrogenophaga sp.]